MDQECIIEFSNFGFQYFSQKEPTLYNIDLKIRRGEKILIAGPSGCGKSTLGHCINGLIPFVYKGTMTGSLKVAGTETRKSSLFQMSMDVGTVLQDSDGQFIGLNVGEDIAFSLENDCIPQEEMHKRVRTIASIVDMEEFLSQDPHELSGGQKQRVSLAGVMVDDVDILLFDEPLANLDPKTGKTAVELISRIASEDRTVVIIEHRIEDVLHRAVDRIVLINDGRIIADDTPDNVLASGILMKCGVREPLYLTAARFAGVPVTAQMRPASLDTFDTETCAPYIRRWFEDSYVRSHEQKKRVMLKVENVSFSYDGIRPILKNVSVDVCEGEMLSIVGKNGAGKTTLASLICGFLEPDEGCITLDGEDLTKYSIAERGEKIGIVMQNPNQMISKTMIYDEVSLGLKVRGLSEDEIQKRVENALRVCGLYEFRNWPISALSFGQKKRVTIASILVLNPRILILDEPTAGQDYRRYSDIMEFLKKLNENGQTIILITHDMHLMLEYTDRAAAFANGEKLADMRSFELLCSPEMTEKTNLKETSLFALAEKCGIQDPLGFVECFIHYDREVRSNEA